MISLKLPETVEKIIILLNNSGFEAYAVGGCVRDMILGETPSDYDITTNAEPSEIKKVFSEFKTIDTGIKHGTVTVIINSFHTEVTTFRCDGKYTDNRHPEGVVFVKNIKEDLSRRDFTINAIAYNNTEKAVDLFGGISDIQNKIIRCVGDPEKRFVEDALRILRAIRFCSVLDFNIEKDTKSAIHNLVKLLDNISKERIFSEVKKLICGKNVKIVLKDYRDIIESIFPEIHIYSDKQYRIVSEMIYLSENDIYLKLASLFYFLTEKDAESMLAGLKSDNETKRKVKSYLKKIDLETLMSQSEIKKVMFYNGEYNLKYSLKLKYLYAMCISDLNYAKKIESVLKTIEEILINKQCYRICDLALNGSDIISFGLAEGKNIGNLQKKLLFAVIDEKIINEKNELIQYAKKLI